MVGMRRLIDRLRRAWDKATRKNIQLNDAAEQILKQAELRGHQVKRVKSQGAEAILVEDPKGGKVFLWSSDDVIDYARSKKWV
jgi:hypothetical protein